MRPSSAVLLVGGSSVLCALFASAAPVLVRISLLKSLTVGSDTEEFHHFVRIGAAGANAATAQRLDPDLLSSIIIPEEFDPEEAEFSPVPMRPELEFTPPSLESPATVSDPVTLGAECSNPNFMERVFGRISDFVKDMLRIQREPRILCAAHAKPAQASIPRLRKPCSANASLPFVHSSGLAPVGEAPRFRPWAFRHRPSTFGGRLRRALYALSPWEGRALAFVMGCGLGVILRMLFVLFVVGVRFVRGKIQQREENEKEGDAYLVLEEELEGIVLFDAASIKAASEEDLPLYDEKQQ